MRALINGWRGAFGSDSLPFYFVQLPGSGARAGWPYLREQQRLSMDLPDTGMVVTIDLLDEDIHPPNKIDVGDRLARWALAKRYEKNIVPSGPLFDRVEFASGRAMVYFSYAESGLMTAIKRGTEPAVENSESTLEHFELADPTGRWFPAAAVIEGSTVVVQSEEVVEPVAVRYAYEINPQHCHLYNRAGLPASPFCSDSDRLDYQPEKIVD
jgi:sialate O-acetylesterase